jgi:uracil-DNA glycosylase
VTRIARALDVHCAALGACRRCVDTPSTVAPVLSACRAPLAMLVGQAPGHTEVERRRGFAGRAGKTMFRWLAEIGIAEDVFRARVYLAAVTRCYPGASPSGRGDRVPSPREIATCSDWLEAELRIIKPPVIIPVGRLAIDRFLGPIALANAVGREHRVKVGGIATVAIPLPHPSGASSWIHQPGHRDLLSRALGLLAAALPDVVRESARRVA